MNKINKVKRSIIKEEIDITIEILTTLLIKKIYF